jgi:hypothetical protein
VTYVALWARAFAYTLGLELVVAVPLLRASEPSRGRRLGAVVFANLASHPIVWFVVPALGLGRAQVPVSEAWAVACEACIYALVMTRASRLRALTVALVANGVSFGMGMALRSAGLV